MALEFAEKARPPAFEFEKRSVEDRQASLEAAERGEPTPVYKDEDWVIVRQHGSKDGTEFPAKQWLQQMQQASRDRPKDMPPSWVRMFNEIFAAWQKGESRDLPGFALKNWAGITPAEQKNCARIGLHSVEDVAAMTEECMRTFGLGGRTLKQKAEAFLDARRSNGAAQELQSLRSENGAQKELIEEMQAQMAEMRAQINSLVDEKPGKGKRN